MVRKLNNMTLEVICDVIDEYCVIIRNNDEIEACCRTISKTLQYNMILYDDIVYENCQKKTGDVKHLSLSLKTSITLSPCSYTLRLYIAFWFFRYVISGVVSFILRSEIQVRVWLRSVVCFHVRSKTTNLLVLHKSMEFK